MRKIRKLASHALRSLRRHRLRSAFMMLGTLVGVTALTAAVAVGRNARQEVLDRFDILFSGSSILVSGGRPSSMGGPHGPSRNTLTLEDLAAVDAAVDAVETWDPWHMPGLREFVWQGNSRNVRIMGHSERAQTVWNRGVSRGSHFTAHDVASAARVALLGQNLAASLFGATDPVGEQIRIGTVPFEVVGILDRQGIDPHGWDRDDEVHVPVSTAMRRLDNADHITAARILIRDDADFDAAVRAVEGALRDQHSLATDAPNDFSLTTPAQVRHMVGSSANVFSTFLPVLAAISIIVGAIIVANLMLIGVNERRSEIGLRKAVGARSRDVWLQFLLESALVTTVGGTLGIALAASFLWFRAAHFGATGSMPWQVVLIGFATSIGVGLVAGVVPARRAAALDPVQTLR
ncbi:MAG: ABC transporter permease [Gemmatimonadetes bacterium]|nr:ABC transporter permease [Gemmatimonadota bacterium]